MNKKLVSFLVGNVLLLIAPLFLICGLIARIDSGGWGANEFFAFAVPFVISIAAGLILTAAFWRNQEKNNPNLRRRDGIGVVAFTWLFVCTIGAIPYMFVGANPAQAIFESVSGFTTTGSSIFGEIEKLPRSILIWRSLTQWVGGFGILVFLVALLSKLGIRGRTLVGGESSVDIDSAATSRIGELAKKLLCVYLLLSVLCFFVLLITGAFAGTPVSFEDALHYTMTTVSTGGFSPHDNSAAHFDCPVIEGVLIVFMFISSVSFVLLYRTVLGGDWGRKAGCEEAIVFCLLVFLIMGAVVTDLMLQVHENFWEALRDAAFPVVSMASSTGFGTVDYDTWPLMSKFFLAFVMIVGGCSGSTAGGLKVIRLVLLYRILKMEIEKTFRPGLVTKIRMDDAEVAESNQYRVLIYIVTAAVILITSSGVVSVMEPQVDDLETAVGAVLGTFFNMGPGFGAVGPTDNFGDCHSYTLLFLSWLMLLGRLEIFVLFALFSKKLWKS